MRRPYGHPSIRAAAACARRATSAGVLVPERVRVRGAERAVVGEDLDVVEAVPAGALERARGWPERRRLRRPAARGPPSRGSARASRTRARRRSGRSSAAMSSKSVGVFQRCQTSNWRPQRGRAARVADQLDRLGDRGRDRPVLATVALVRLERDPQTEPLRLGGDLPQAVDDDARASSGRGRARSGQADDAAGAERREAVERAQDRVDALAAGPRAAEEAAAAGSRARPEPPTPSRARSRGAARAPRRRGPRRASAPRRRSRRAPRRRTRARSSAKLAVSVVICDIETRGRRRA